MLIFPIGRLNPDLGEFVSTIYSRKFKPQKVQARLVAIRLKSLADEEPADGVLNEAQRFLLALSDVMLRLPQNVLQAPRLAVAVHDKATRPNDSNVMPHPVSLALIRLKTVTARPEQVGYEVHVRGEAAIAAALVKSLQKCSPGDDIFVATPHRIQRQAVKAALKRDDVDSLAEAMGSITIGAPISESGQVTVDTVERLQGNVSNKFDIPTLICVL